MKKILFAFLVLSIGTIFAQTTVNSLSALRSYLDRNNVNVKLSPGTYSLDASDVESGEWGATQGLITNKAAVMLFTGNNSTYDFTGVTILMNPDILSAFGNIQVYELNIVGNNNVLKNLKLFDNGTVNDAPRNSAISIVMDGSANTIQGFDITVKGSYPYGYGDAYGKGGSSIISHKKHSGFLIRGKDNTVRNTTLNQYAFGHGFVMQASTNPTIENCSVRGEVRTTDDMLKEQGTGSPADDVDFMTVWGYKLPAGFMMSKAEEGIRAYNSGTTIINGEITTGGTSNPTIINNTVRNMRTGLHLSFASGTKTVEGVTIIGCENGFSLGSGTAVVNCAADAAYGPAFNGEGGVLGNITILEPENGYYNGSRTLASVTGGTLTLNHNNVTIPSNIEIRMGTHRQLRHQPGGSLEYQVVTNFSGATVNNNTNATVELGSGASNNNIVTCGNVDDNGSGNKISKSNNCDAVTTGAAFIPDPNKIYYIENPTHGYRIAANGNSEAPYTVSINDTSVDARWKFTQHENGSWHIDRAEGGGLPRLRTNGVNNDPDMQATTSKGTYTQYQITPSTTVSNTYYLTLTQAPELYQRLRVLGNGSIDFNKTTNLGVSPSLRFVEVSTSTSGQIVHITKRNASGFAIDGNQGGDNAQNVYLWSENDNNVNQQWIEINRGNGYYSYQKYGTNYCIDGNQGGTNGQNVYLWTCSDNNQNQHWQKIDAGGGAVKLVKRNASGFALNGGSGGADAQNVNLYDSSVTSRNIQWYISVVGTSAKSTANVVNATDSAIIYPNPVLSTATITGAADSTIRVYDITGAVLFTKDVVTDEEQIDLSLLATGVYYAQVEGEQSISVIKIMKQ